MCIYERWDSHLNILNAYELYPSINKLALSLNQGRVMALGLDLLQDELIKFFENSSFKRKWAILIYLMP